MLTGLSISDLQREGRRGNTLALAELGRRVLDLEIFEHDDYHHCEWQRELHKLQIELGSEPPPECPHCGKFIDCATPTTPHSEAER